MAKHFGKNLEEITLEALIKLEQLTPEDQDQDQGGVPKRAGPSLAYILGRTPTAATLGLNDSISDCISNEDGEFLPERERI